MQLICLVAIEDLICSTHIWKSLPRWRIMEEEIKNRVFNSIGVSSERGGVYDNQRSKIEDWSFRKRISSFREEYMKIKDQKLKIEAFESEYQAFERLKGWSFRKLQETFKSTELGQLSGSQLSKADPGLLKALRQSCSWEDSFRKLIKSFPKLCRKIGESDLNLDSVSS